MDIGTICLLVWLAGILLLTFLVNLLMEGDDLDDDAIWFCVVLWPFIPVPVVGFLAFALILSPAFLIGWLGRKARKRWIKKA